MKNDMVGYVCVTVVVLMAVGETATLSTFIGTKKNPDLSTKPPPPTKAPGRECQEGSCKKVEHVVCMHDPMDRKLRCLCSNTRSPPVNAKCPNDPKPLNAGCKADSDCLEGAHCSTHVNSSSAAKSCMCKDGFFEEDYVCNAGFTTTTPSTLSLLIAFSILCLASKSDSTF